MSHTPAPWVADPLKREPGYWIYGDKGDRYLGIIHSNDEEDYFNAALVANAPELLVALEFAYDLLAKESAKAAKGLKKLDGKNVEVDTGHLTYIKQVIARAKGEASK